MTPLLKLRTHLAEVQIALMLLTRLPSVRLSDPVPPISAAVWAFPLAGLAIGSITALVLGAAVWSGLPVGLAAGIALAFGLLATGALHEDGLADVADGFGGGRDRTHKLEIMRDSRIGSYGTLALILSLGLRWQTIAVLAERDLRYGCAVVIALAMTSRAALPVALTLMPAARSDGLGHAARSSGGVRPAIAVAIGAMAAFALLGPGTAGITITLQAVTLVAMGRLAMRQIAGQTGDVLGAMQQTAEIVGLLAVVAMSG